jgi:hypothetical protein
VKRYAEHLLEAARSRLWFLGCDTQSFNIVTSELLRTSPSDHRSVGSPVQNLAS